MEGVWLISYLVLWGVTLLLALVVLAHSRLLGLLHHRFGPAHARPMADGPPLGTQIERLTARRLDGSAWDYSFPAPTDLLLVFVSPQCATCNELMPHVCDLARSHSDLDLVLMSTMDDLEMNRAYARFARVGKLTYLLAGETASRLDIEGTPYAIHLDPQGVVTAKGLVNNYEHLLSLRRPLATPALGPETLEPEIISQTGSTP